MFYADDSFFTLSAAHQAGLVALSGAIAAALLVAVRRGTRRWPQAWRVLGALAAFAAFVWLVPQAHDTYYRAIIPGLPAQIVIGTPPRITDLAQLLSFTRKPSLADHSTGLLGWALLFVALLPVRASNRGEKQGKPDNSPRIR